jgi:hypothetical protein
MEDHMDANGDKFFDSGEIFRPVYFFSRLNISVDGVNLVWQKIVPVFLLHIDENFNGGC